MLRSRVGRPEGARGVGRGRGRRSGRGRQAVAAARVASARPWGTRGGAGRAEGGAGVRDRGPRASSRGRNCRKCSAEGDEGGGGGGGRRGRGGPRPSGEQSRPQVSQVRRSSRASAPERLAAAIRCPAAGNLRCPLRIVVGLLRWPSRPAKQTVDVLELTAAIQRRPDTLSTALRNNFCSECTL